MIIIFKVIFIVVLGVIIGIICYRRKKALWRQQLSMNQEYIYMEIPKYIKNKAILLYKGKPVDIAQPDGIPYSNNSNIPSVG